MKPHNRFDLHSFFIFDPDCFALTESSGASPFTLEPAKAIEKRLHLRPEDHLPKTRCPAWHARLIVPTLEQVLGLLDRHYFPGFPEESGGAA